MNLPVEQTITPVTEAMGQLIAYARSLGIAPPWSK